MLFLVSVYFTDPSPAYCLEQPDSGPCEAATARWFYDPLAKECKGFTYGGCEGNRNNFQDKESCEKACYSGEQSHVDMFFLSVNSSEALWFWRKLYFFFVLVYKHEL